MVTYSEPSLPLWFLEQGKEPSLEREGQESSQGSSLESEPGGKSGNHNGSPEVLLETGTHLATGQASKVHSTPSVVGQDHSRQMLNLGSEAVWDRD